MARHRHILKPHCRDGKCRWEVCVTCHGFGILGKRWAINPYLSAKEPDVSND